MITPVTSPYADVRVPALPDESFERVLCVVAHPDDMEYGASGAVATWTARGVRAFYLMLTRGEAGMDSTPPEQTREIRTADQIAAGEAVGVERVDFLENQDGVLEHSLSLRREIARAIRSVRPDVVLTQNWDIVAPWGLNQADHRVAGLATLDGVRDAGNRWVFRDLLDEGLEPWGVRWLLVAGSPAPTHGVVLDGAALERAVASLEAHAGYLAGIPGHPPAREFVTQVATMMGGAMGVPHAALFRVWDLQSPPAIQPDDAAN